MIQMSLVGLGLALFVGMLAIALYQSGWSRIRGGLARGTWAMRRRYCWLLCAAPAILGAYAWFNPHMLQALLLVRDTRPFSDIFKITVISFFSSGVGLALCRLIDLNGDLRFGKISDLLSTDLVETSPTVMELSRPHQQMSWTWRRIMMWWILGAVFPAFVVMTSHKEGGSSWLVLILGAMAGGITGNAIALFLAGLQRWVLGHIDNTAQAGILPFESCVRKIKPWKFGEWDVPGSQLARRLFGDGDRGFSWLLQGPGYTDPTTRILLPGQAQVIILAIFSGLIYLFWYYKGLADTTWQSLDWPSGFFALQCVFLIGSFMAGLAFWLDRFGLPPIVFAVLYTTTVFYFNVTDHYFEIMVAPASTQKFAPVASEDRANAYVAAATVPAEEVKSYDQLYWADVLKGWRFPVVNNKKTLVVVTASGGGIQAAAWTAHVLTRLDERFPGFSQSIGLISAVSGGSVGSMYYLGHRGLIDASRAPEATRMMSTEPVRQAVKRGAEQSSLEAVAWGVAFPDFVRTVVPPAAPPLVDRGWALESWWWNSMGNGTQNRKLMEAVTIRDLIPLIESGRLPPVIFNATCVETGQRVQISPLHVAVAKARSDHPDDWRPESETMGTSKEVAQQLVSAPIDFLDYYDAALGHQGERQTAPWSGANVRVSTAARLSATFSYVTPVTRPSPTEGFGYRAAFQRIGLWARGQQTDLQRRLNHHFCDGGYADNPGLVTAVRSLRSLMEHYRQSKTQPPFDQVLVVRIEPFPQSAAQHAKDNTGFLSAVYGPSAALSAMRVSTQAERGELELQLLQDAHGATAHTNQLFNDSVTTLQHLVGTLPQGIDAKKSIQNIVEAVGVKPEQVSDLVPSQWRRAIVPDAESLASITKRLEDIQLPKAYSEQIGKAQTQMKSVMDLVSNPQQGEFTVPIHSVTFRFETYESDRKKASDPKSSPQEPNQPAKPKQPRKEPIEPPLTWTLTRTQIEDLTRAWDRIVLEENWSTVNISTADNLAPEGIGMFFEPVKEGQPVNP